MAEYRQHGGLALQDAVGGAIGVTPVGRAFDIGRRRVHPCDRQGGRVHVGQVQRRIEHGDRHFAGHPVQHVGGQFVTSALE